ncbi:MAG: hypothetical protein NC244_13575 [Alistipes senegalensis]|nr:hypothetical protein [Alistipes senegalensis]
MTKKTEQELTPYERAGMYTVLSKTETETHYIETIRTHDGVIVVNRIPKHTREEQAIIDKSIVRALAKFANPNVDMSSVEYMELII